MIKNVPKRYKNIFDQACLSHKKNNFLEKQDIRFIYGNSVINTFQTRPSLRYLLMGKKVYFIIKSRNKKVSRFFDTLSEEAKIGIIIHELSHVIDYEKMSFIQFIFFSFKYLTSQSYKTKVEKRVDSYAVNVSKEYNLAWKKSQFKKFYTNFEKKYWMNIRKYYLTEDDVEKNITQ